MDQNRLYYVTPYVKNFMCTVISCTQNKKGTWDAILNQTAFYPEGGGQPSDTGTLNGVKVLHVCEKGEEIIHELETPLEEGTLAEGIIDWQKRYDNMQQHTGEHIFSGLVHKHFGYDNVGFHMGTDEVTVDFNGIITQEQLDALEDEANQLIYDNVSVHVFYPSKEELEQLDYRSKKELTGVVRIVEIPGGDICACCGTHVETTGEVGIIKLRTMINYKGGVRFSVLCGDRALENFEAKTEQMQTISNLLSAKPEKAAEAVSHLKEESGRKDGEINRLWQRILTMQADVYPQGQNALAVFEQGMTPVLVRQFANLLVEQEKGETVLVCSGDDASGYNYTAGSLGRDMRAFGKELNARLQGRGGGSTQMVQGTFRASREEIEKVFQELARIEA